MIAWLTALAAATAPQAPDVVTLQVPLAERVVRATATPSALTLVTHEAAAGKRWLRSHDRGDAGAVPSQPTRAPYALEPDVVAFALADVDPAPGREVVLFTAERAVAVTTNGDAGPTYVPLFEHRLVWPAAPADDAVALTAADLPLPAAAAPAPLAPAPPTAFRPVADELEELERRRMVEALAAAAGVQIAAAGLIGMPIRTFATKVRRYGIDPADAPREAAVRCR